MEQEQLNPQQRAAAEYAGAANNVLVVAGAGCGKTKTMIARATHLIRSGVEASEILMLTFTNRAAREMKQRLRAQVGELADEVVAGTFHSFCLKVISQLPGSFDVKGLTIIDVDDQDSLMGLVRSRFISKSDRTLSQQFPKPAELVRYLSYSRNTCRTAESYLAKNTEMSEENIDLCCRIFSDYQRAKNRRGYLDFDDLLVVFAEKLAEKPQMKADITRLFKEVLVDEMQDTNPLQFKILRHFADEHTRLFCVGDPAQSIYRFRGAEFEHVYQFGEMLKNSITLELSLNYRSNQEILDFSNWLLGESPLEYKNQLVADKGEAGYKPKLVDFDSKIDECAFLADEILEKVDGGQNYRDMMILVRSSFDAKPIEAELIQRDIPYVFIGGTSLTKSAHVRDVLALLRVVRNEDDDLAWMRFLKLWAGLGEKTAEKLISAFEEQEEKPAIDTLAAELKSEHGAVVAYKSVFAEGPNAALQVGKAVKQLTSVLKTRYDKWNQRERDLELLEEVAKRYVSLGDFIDAFTLEPIHNTQLNELEQEDAVCLITVHSAKGTEAQVCFVAQAKQGSYPHTRSLGELAAEEEERRVLYVALTRAKDELYVTRSHDERATSMVLNNPAEGESSYFLEDVPAELVDQLYVGWKPQVQGPGISGLKDQY
jgi:DNA helicase-2/ATP-dependent DNA helicase PcrA